MKILLFSIFAFAAVTFFQVSKHFDGLFESKEFHVSIPTQAKPQELLAATETVIKASLKQNIDELKDIENLDFTAPKTAEQTNKKSIAKKKILNFIKLENKNTEIKDISLKILEDIAPTAKLAVKSREYELDYSKTDEQKPFIIKKLKAVAWASHGLELKEYSAPVEAARAIVKVDKQPTQNEAKSYRLPEAAVANNSKKNVNAIIDNNTVDRISTEASAIEKSTTDEPEELVFFDYSTSGADSSPKVIKEIAKKEAKPLSTNISSIVSSTVNSMEPVIKSGGSKLAKLQQIAERMNRPKKQNRSPAIEKNQQNNKSVAAHGAGEETAGEALNEAVKKLMGKSAPIDECLTTQTINSEYSYEYVLEMRSIGVTNHFKKVHNFDIQFQDNLDELERDFGEGQIILSGKAKGELNIRRAIFNARGHYPTSIDLALEEASAEISIPSFQIDKMGEITQELNIADVGAHFLVELDRSTEDVELGLDHNYKAKVYLDKNYNIVDRGASDYYFVLFIGVDSGNTIVQFKNIRGEVLSKITHLSAGVIHYEPNFYAEYSNDQISFFEENVLSTCKSMLGIQPEEISSWAFDRKFKQENLNTLSIAQSTYPVGSRKYYKLTHLDEPVFVGRWNHENIVVPSEQYMNQVLNQFNVSGGECLVQVNLTEKPMAIKYNGLSPKGGLNLEIAVLDEDGKFYVEPSDKTKRLFILGEAQGIINVEITYPDNTKHHLQTYCSQNTYLVEQL